MSSDKEAQAITVSDPQKEGGFFSVKVTYNVSWDRTEDPISFRREYFDFYRFANMLDSECVNVLLPEFPPEKILGATKPEFLKERAEALQKFLRGCYSNPVLRDSNSWATFWGLPLPVRVAWPDFRELEKKAAEEQNAIALALFDDPLFGLPQLEKKQRIHFITDVNGSLPYLEQCVHASSILSYTDASPPELQIADDGLLVFGGNGFCKGSGSIRIMRQILALKASCPQQVVLLMGDKDVAKMRLTSELESDDSDASLEMEAPSWIPEAKQVSLRAYLERLVRARERLPAHAPITTEFLRPHNTTANRLRWMLKHMFDSTTEFEERREELALLSETSVDDVTDDAVVQSFKDEVAPSGAMRQYLMQAQLVYVSGPNMFVSGGLLTPAAGAQVEVAFGHVPGRDSRLGSAVTWTKSVNRWAREQVLGWCNADQWDRSAQPYTRGGSMLMEYATAAYSESVLSGRHLHMDYRPVYFPADVAAKLTESGVRRVLVGGMPIGNSPFVLHDNDIDVIMTNTSNARSWNDRGHACTTVEVCDERVSFEGELETGQPIAYEITVDGGDGSEPYVGHQLTDGRFVRAKLAARRARDGAEYVLSAPCPKGNHLNFEYTFASTEEVKNSLAKHTATASTESCVSNSLSAIAFISDAAGDWDYFAACVARSAPLLEIDADTGALIVSQGTMFVYGGNAYAKEDTSSNAVVSTLVSAKRNYPEQVVLLLGENDIAQITTDFLPEYVSMAQLVALFSSTMFVHGGVFPSADAAVLGAVPGSAAIASVLLWVTALNDFALKHVSGGPQLAKALVQYASSDASVVKASHVKSSTAEPRVLPEATAASLLAFGVRRVVVGRSVQKACPFLVRDHGVEVVVGSTSHDIAFSVVVKSGLLSIRGDLPDSLGGRRVSYNTGLPGSIAGINVDEFVGLCLEDGRWVRAKMAEGGNDYLLSKYKAGAEVYSYCTPSQLWYSTWKSSGPAPTPKPRPPPPEKALEPSTPAIEPSTPQEAPTAVEPAPPPAPVPHGPSSSLKGLIAGSVAVGSEWTLNFHANTEGGDRLSHGDFPVVAQVITEQAGGDITSQATVVNNRDGSFVISHTPAIAGVFRVTATIDGLPLGKEFRVLALGGPSAQHCKVETAPHAATINTPCEFVIACFDSGGNAVAAEGTIDVTVTSQHGASPSAKVRSVDDAKCAITFEPLLGGRHEVRVAIAGEEVRGSPFTVNVAGGPHAPSTRAKPGPAQVEAGTAWVLDLTSYTESGSRVTHGGYPVTAAVTAPSGARSEADVTDNGDGSYSAKFRPEQAGVHRLEVAIAGEAIGDAFTVVVPGAVSASGCKIDTVPASACLGSPWTFSFLCCDGAGNAVTTKASTACSVTPPFHLPAFAGEVVDGGHARHTVTFTPAIGGAHSVRVMVGGEELAGSPFTVAVDGGPHAPSTKATPGPEVVKAGCEWELALALFTSSGSRVTHGGYPVQATVTTPSGSKSARPEVADKGDGTYSVVFRPEEAGVHEVEVAIAGEAVGKSFTFAVPGAAYCAKVLTSDSTTHVHTPWTLTLTTVDANEIPVPANGVVKASVQPPYGTCEYAAEVKEGEGGACTVSFEPRIAGQHSVVVTMGAAFRYESTPFDVSGGPHAASTKLAPGPAQVESGTEWVLLVECHSEDGSRVTHGGYPVTATVTSPEGSRSDAAVADKGDGSYLVSFRPEQAGVHKLEVAIASERVGDVFEVVVPGAPSPAHFKLLDTTTPAAVGDPWAITLLCCDAAGVTTAPKTSEAIALAAHVVPPHENEAATVDAVVTSRGESKWSVSFVPRVGGRHVLYAGVGGESVCGAPFEVDVPGGAHGASTLLSSAPEQVNVADTWHLRAEARTASGQAVGHGGYPCEAIATCDGGETAIAAVTDNGDGSYDLTFGPVEVVGRHKVVVSVAGASVETEFTVVAPGVHTRDLSTSVLDSPDFCTSVVAGHTLSFVLRTHDGDKVLSEGGLEAVVWAELNGEALGDGSRCVCRDNGNGTYSGSITMTRSGSVVVKGSVDGVALAAEYSLTVTPGGICASKCVASGAGCVGGYTNSPISFVVTAFDEFGNQWTTGGATFRGEFGDRVANIVDNKDGTYTVSLPEFTEACTVSVDVTLKGCSSPLPFVAGPILGSPFELDIIPDREHNEILKQFKKADTSGDGTISDVEFALLLDSLGATLSFKEKLALFMGIDEDKSNQLEFEEFERFYLKYWKNLPSRVDYDEDETGAIECTEEDEQLCLEAFENYQNDDGQIDHEGWDRVLSDLGIVLRKKDRETLFREIDKDNSGGIAYQEFEDWWFAFSMRQSASVIDPSNKREVSWNDQLEASLKAKFDKYDPNGDNQLGFLEFATLVEEHGKKVLPTSTVMGLFERVDDNNSGSITYDEFREWWLVFQSTRRVD